MKPELPNWTFEGEDVLEPIEGFHGFVYLITNKNNGRKYIGQKTFYYKQRRKMVDSGWLKYYGSSNALKEDVLSGHEIEREILYLTKNKSESHYMEVREIILQNAILDESYYNAEIRHRVSYRQLGNRHNLR